MTVEAIRNWMKDDEAKLLITELQAEFPSMEISQVPFLRWMVNYAALYALRILFHLYYIRFELLVHMIMDANLINE